MKPLYALLACAILVSACGQTREDRIASGALIGAAAGGVVGAASGSTATGMALGAVVGGAAGGLTDEAEINLGKPIWK